MADKDDIKRDPKSGKFLGKYDTLEDAEKGHSELEKKYGEQAKTYGEQKKQYEQMQAEFQKYQQWANEAKPIVEWYTRNQQPISQWWNAHQGQSGQGQGQVNYGQAQQAMGQAAQMVAQTPGVELLTPQEKQALISQTAQTLIQQTLGPWTNQFAKSVESWGQNQSKQIEAQLDQRHKAFSDVMWRTLERLVPQDKLTEARQWHDEALKYADPKNIDPLSLASERLELMSKSSRLENELKTEREKRENYEKQAMGTLGDSGGGLFRKPSDLKEMPKSRDERYKNVLGSVKEAVGVEGLRETFPSI